MNRKHSKHSKKNNHGGGDNLGAAMPQQQLELFVDEPFCLRITIQDAVRIFRDNYWRHVACAKTTESHLKRIVTFFKGYYLDTVSKADVERFRRFLETMRYSPATINKAHMILSRMFRKFEEYKEGGFVGGIDFRRVTLPPKNPASQVPKVNEQKFARRVFITPEKKKLLCSYADEDLCEIINGLYWTQLRPSDFFRITSENIDLKQKSIFGIQHKTITSKNPSGVPYKVPIPEAMIDMIRRRLEGTKQGTPIFRHTNLRKRWLKIRALAGMPNIQLRDLRGSAASHLLNSGTDVETVRKKLGHTTLRMIPVYDKRSDDLVVDATENLSKV